MSEDDYNDPASYEHFARWDGDYSLHTVVQVSDEQGVPLATFVDAIEIGVVNIHYEESREHWAALDEAFDEAVVTIRRRVDNEGIALSETTTGVGKRSVSETCAEADSLWADEGVDLRVVDIGSLPVSFPDTVALVDLGRSLALDRTPEINAALVQWFYGAKYFVLRRDMPGGVQHAAFGVNTSCPSDSSDPSFIRTVTLDFSSPPADRGCGNAETLSALEPGTYHAAMIASGPGWAFPYGQYVEAHDPVEEFWIDLGEVTITD
jgi:hypothetical protein